MHATLNANHKGKATVYIYILRSSPNSLFSTKTWSLLHPFSVNFSHLNKHGLSRKSSLCK